MFAKNDEPFGLAICSRTFPVLGGGGESLNIEIRILDFPSPSKYWKTIGS
jgi:hypothetical protein